MAVHIARYGMVRVLANGTVVPLASTPPTIQEHIESEIQWRVFPDPTYAPNATGYPTLEAYLTVEETAGFSLTHLDQTYVITYS